jgi:hypothetical protein
MRAGETLTDPADLVREAIKAHLESRRADPDFQQRLKARVEADREILRRLEEPEPPVGGR